MNRPLLKITGLSKHFGGLRAVDGVSFDIQRGEILGLLGPNGAGKTVCFNLVSGVYKPTAGQISFDGQRTDGLSPHVIAGLGIGRTFQIVQPFGKLTVLENIMIGAFLRHRSVDDARAVALRVARTVGLYELKDVEAGTLPIGGLKRLEVARTLATEPTILLLDEVMAGQSQSDTLKMVELVRAIRDSGVTVIAIEHNMQAIMSLSDRIVVIDSGKVIAEGAPETVVRERRVIEAYLGEDFVHAQGL